MLIDYRQTIYIQEKVKSCRYSDNRCSDKESTAGRVGSVFLGRQGDSERFRCVGITLSEIYENTTTRHISSALPAASWVKKVFVTEIALHWA